MTTGLKANVDGSAAIQVGGVDAITLTSAGAASFVTSPMTIQGGSAAAPSLTFSGDTNTGIFSPAADTIAFTEGGVEAMRIDSSGNVGIGTGSPEERLTLSVSNPVDGRVASLRNTGSSSLTGTKLWFNQNTVGNWNIGQPAGVNAFVFCNSADSSSERARITSGGYFKASNAGAYVSSTGSYHEFNTDFSGEWSLRTRHTHTSNPYGIAIQYFGAAPNGTGNEFLYVYDNAALRASIRSNGGLANYSANNVNLSDRREKTNFAPAKNYLDVICAIPVQTFNYIDQNMEEDPGETLGVVAQDVQAVAPEMVMESNWGTEEEPKMRLSIYQTDLQYALMKSIQELKAIVDAQAAEIAALKGSA